MCGYGELLLLWVSAVADGPDTLTGVWARQHDYIAPTYHDPHCLGNFFVIKRETIIPIGKIIINSDIRM